MNTVTSPVRTAAERLHIEEADAWFEYLDATRNQGQRYDEVEPWAWNRLGVKLRAIQARRIGQGIA